MTVSGPVCSVRVGAEALWALLASRVPGGGSASASLPLALLVPTAAFPAAALASASASSSSSSSSGSSAETAADASVSPAAAAARGMLSAALSSSPALVDPARAAAAAAAALAHLTALLRASVSAASVSASAVAAPAALAELLVLALGALLSRPAASSTSSTGSSSGSGSGASVAVPAAAALALLAALRPHVAAHAAAAAAAGATDVSAWAGAGKLLDAVAAAAPELALAEGAAVGVALVTAALSATAETAAAAAAVPAKKGGKKGAVTAMSDENDDVSSAVDSASLTVSEAHALATVFAPFLSSWLSAASSKKAAAAGPSGGVGASPCHTALAASLFAPLCADPAARAALAAVPALPAAAVAALALLPGAHSGASQSQTESALSAPAVAIAAGLHAVTVRTLVDSALLPLALSDLPALAAAPASLAAVLALLKAGPRCALPLAAGAAPGSLLTLRFCFAAAAVDALARAAPGALRALAGTPAAQQALFDALLLLAASNSNGDSDDDGDEDSESAVSKVTLLSQAHVALATAPVTVVEAVVAYLIEPTSAAGARLPAALFLPHITPLAASTGGKKAGAASAAAMPALMATAVPLLTRALTTAGSAAVKQSRALVRPLFGALALAVSQFEQAESESGDAASSSAELSARVSPLAEAVHVVLVLNPALLATTVTASSASAAAVKGADSGLVTAADIALVASLATRHMYPASASRSAAAGAATTGGTALVSAAVVLSSNVATVTTDAILLSARTRARDAALQLLALVAAHAPALAAPHVLPLASAAVAAVAAEEAAAKALGFPFPSTTRAFVRSAQHTAGAGSHAGNANNSDDDDDDSAATVYGEGNGDDEDDDESAGKHGAAVSASAAAAARASQHPASAPSRVVVPGSQLDVALRLLRSVAAPALAPAPVLPLDAAVARTPAAAHPAHAALRGAQALLLGLGAVATTAAATRAEAEAADTLASLLDLTAAAEGDSEPAALAALVDVNSAAAVAADEAALPPGLPSLAAAARVLPAASALLHALAAASNGSTSGVKVDAASRLLLLAAGARAGAGCARVESREVARLAARAQTAVAEAEEESKGGMFDADELAILNGDDGSDDEDNDDDEDDEDDSEYSEESRAAAAKKARSRSASALAKALARLARLSASAATAGAARTGAASVLPLLAVHALRAARLGANAAAPAFTAPLSSADTAASASTAAGSAGVGAVGSDAAGYDGAVAARVPPSVIAAAVVALLAAALTAPGKAAGAGKASGAVTASATATAVSAARALLGAFPAHAQAAAMAAMVAYALSAGPNNGGDSADAGVSALALVLPAPSPVPSAVIAAPVACAALRAAVLSVVASAAAHPAFTAQLARISHLAATTNIAVANGGGSVEESAACEFRFVSQSFAVLTARLLSMSTLVDAITLPATGDADTVSLGSPTSTAVAAANGTEEAVQHHWRSLGASASATLTALSATLATQHFAAVFKSLFALSLRPGATPGSAAALTLPVPVAAVAAAGPAAVASVAAASARTGASASANSAVFTPARRVIVKRLLLLVIERVRTERQRAHAEAFLHLVSNKGTALAKQRRRAGGSADSDNDEADGDNASDDDDDADDDDEIDVALLTDAAEFAHLDAAGRRAARRKLWLAQMRRRQRALTSIVPALTTQLIAPFLAQHAAAAGVKDVLAKWRLTVDDGSVDDNGDDVAAVAAGEDMENLQAALLCVDELSDVACLLSAPTTAPAAALAALSAATVGGVKRAFALPAALTASLLDVYALVLRVAVVAANGTFLPQQHSAVTTATVSKSSKKGSAAAPAGVSVAGPGVEQWALLLSSSLLCVATLAARCGIRSLKHLSHLAPLAIAVLDKTADLDNAVNTIDDSDDDDVSAQKKSRALTESGSAAESLSAASRATLQLSSLAVLDAVIRSFPQFLEPYLPALLSALLRPTLPERSALSAADLRFATVAGAAAATAGAAATDATGAGAASSPANGGTQSNADASAYAASGLVSTCLHTAAVCISPRVLLPPLLSAWHGAISPLTGGAVSAARLLALVARVAETLTPMGARRVTARRSAAYGGDGDGDGDDGAMAEVFEFAAAGLDGTAAFGDDDDADAFDLSDNDERGVEKYYDALVQFFTNAMDLRRQFEQATLQATRAALAKSGGKNSGSSASASTDAFAALFAGVGATVRGSKSSAAMVAAAVAHKKHVSLHTSLLPFAWAERSASAEAAAAEPARAHTGNVWADASLLSVERGLVDAMVAFILKLDEDNLKQLFAAMTEWVTAHGSPVEDATAAAAAAAAQSTFAYGSGRSSNSGQHDDEDDDAASSAGAGAAAKSSDPFAENGTDVSLSRALPYLRLAQQLARSLRHIFTPYLLPQLPLLTAYLAAPARLGKKQRALIKLVAKTDAKVLKLSLAAGGKKAAAVLKGKKGKRRAGDSDSDDDADDADDGGKSGSAAAADDEDEEVRTARAFLRRRQNLQIWRAQAASLALGALTGAVEADTVLAKGMGGQTVNIINKDALEKLVPVVCAQLEVGHTVRMPDSGATSTTDSSSGSGALTGTVTLPAAAVAQDRLLAYPAFAEDVLIPCLGAISEHLGYSGPAVWDTLATCTMNHMGQYQHTRSAATGSAAANPSMVRFAALRALHEYFLRNKEEFLLLLPKVVPAIAERMQDANVLVEKLAQDVVKTIEALAGESISEYLN